MRRRHPITASLLALPLTLPLTGSAGPLDDGLAAFNAGNYPQAYAL